MRASALGLSLLALLTVLGCKERSRRPLPSGKVERTWVPLSALPLRGPATAKVTLVLFCDFASPYCSRATEQVNELRRGAGDSLRVQYRYNPLPIYPHSQVAAEAAAAAAEQGQFWRYHDLLFSHRDALDRPSLERYAEQLGLDVARFRDALDSERAREKVDADAILAAQLQARGVPVFFVNGRALRGSVDLAALQALVAEEVAVADAMLDKGVAPRELYQRLADAPVESAPASAEAPAKQVPHDESPLDPDPVYKVEVGDSPSKGPADAKVTVVLWSDFECERCGAFESVLDTAAAAFPKDVRIVWKFRPVPDHPGAILASESALAAGAQGKFWQMHDKLFADSSFERPRFEEHARQLGLDLERFQAALDERSYSAHVARDLDVSETLAIGNLPTLFINGRRLEYGEVRRGQLESTTLTLESVRALIATELQNADRALKQGAAPENLYATLIANGREAGPKRGELPPLPKGVYQVDIGNSPVRGPKVAPITLVTFSDFQCPYCARLEKTLEQVRSRYGDRVRIVWKDAPNTEIHPEAMAAHEAARAAGEQGRFWEMHDKIFSRPFALQRSLLERYATELGLDMDKFHTAMTDGGFQKAIREDTEYGVNLVGPSGTPAVLVNGRLLPGAFPFETFRQVIDEELERLKIAGPGGGT